MEIPKHLQISKTRAQKIIREKIKKLRKYFKNSGYKKAVVGLSGGLDSGVACALACKALGPKNIYPVRMPYFGISSKEGFLNAQKLADELKIPKKNRFTISINKPVDASWALVSKHKGGNPKIRKGNLMARERMKILFDLSSALHAVVLGTEDKTEERLGYYTLGGDQMSGVEPIKDLWKTQVYQLGKYLNVPSKVLDKTPSPELWKGQTAERELGANYIEIDTVLSGIEKFKLKPFQIEKRFGIPRKKIDLILKQIKKGKTKGSLPYLL